MYLELQDRLASESFALPCTYRKMTSVTIAEQQQYVLARSAFDFTSCPPSSVQTPFFDPKLRCAKFEYFVVHSLCVHSTSVQITQAFAAVRWPQLHPARHAIGKPFQIWCTSVYESDSRNFITPVENIVSLLLTSPCCGRKCPCNCAFVVVISFISIIICVQLKDLFYCV